VALIHEITPASATPATHPSCRTAAATDAAARNRPTNRPQSTATDAADAVRARCGRRYRRSETSTGTGAKTPSDDGGGGGGGDGSGSGNGDGDDRCVPEIRCGRGKECTFPGFWRCWRRKNR
jgi:hypothetical protein